MQRRRFSDRVFIIFKLFVFANIGWLRSIVTKIKFGALTQAATNHTLNETVRPLQTLKQSRLRFDTRLKVKAICFGLNQQCTKVIAYTLREDSVDCIEFTGDSYKLLWVFSIRPFIGYNDKLINMSLLGQGLSILTGYVDEQYGQALTVRLFKITIECYLIL